MRSVKIIIFSVITVCILSTIMIRQVIASYNESDMRQAEQFIQSLPQACSNSYITTKKDGTVVINLNCRKGSNTTVGTIEIKNGVIRRIK